MQNPCLDIQVTDLPFPMPSFPPAVCNLEFVFQVLQSMSCSFILKRTWISNRHCIPVQFELMCGNLEEFQNQEEFG